MKGRGRRQKGANGEREFFEHSNVLSRDIEWPYRDKDGRIFMRHPAPRHCEGQSDNHDALGVLPISIEVKRQERLQIPKWIAQVREQTRDHQTPILAYRQNGKPWTVLAVMDLEEWKEYLKWKLESEKKA